jgi:hypothetical protein
MQWFKNFRTSVKILFLVFLMILLMLTVSFSGYRTSAFIADRMYNMYRNSAEPAIMMAEARAYTIQNRYLVLNLVYSESDEEMDAYAREIDANRKRVSELVEKYSKTDTTDAEKRLLSELGVAREAALAKQDEAMTLGRYPENEDALYVRLRSGGDIYAAQDRMLDVLRRQVELLVRDAES